MSRRGERPSAEALAALPVAIDAMGGDKSPGEIVEGAHRVAADDGIPVVLVGPPDQVGDTLGLPLIPCTEVIAMDEDPAGGVRRKKDSSLVRAAELVRDGQASAWVLRRPPRSVCPHCQSAKTPHVVCPSCGWYKGRQAVEVD